MTSAIQQGNVVQQGAQWEWPYLPKWSSVAMAVTAVSLNLIGSLLSKTILNRVEGIKEIDKAFGIAALVCVVLGAEVGLEVLKKLGVSIKTKDVVRGMYTAVALLLAGGTAEIGMTIATVGGMSTNLALIPVTIGALAGNHSTLKVPFAAFPVCATGGLIAIIAGPESRRNNQRVHHFETAAVVGVTSLYCGGEVAPSLGFAALFYISSYCIRKILN
jgi:hypothetical protein